MGPIHHQFQKINYRVYDFTSAKSRCQFCIF